MLSRPAGSDGEAVEFGAGSGRASSFVAAGEGSDSGSTVVTTRPPFPRLQAGRPRKGVRDPHSGPAGGKPRMGEGSDWTIGFEGDLEPRNKRSVPTPLRS